MRALFRSVPQSQWKDFIQNFSNALGFAGEVSNPQASSIEQTSQPFDFSYDYTREKYGQWDSRQITPPLPQSGWELAPGVKQIEPADDINIGSPGDQVYTSSVTLPAGWLLYPPESTGLTEDWAEYHAKYTFKDGTFTAERRLVTKKDKIPLSDWDKYLKFRRAIYDDELHMEQLLNPGQASKQNTSSESKLQALRERMIDNLVPLLDVLGDSVQMPAHSVTVTTINAAKDTKTIRIDQLPIVPPSRKRNRWVKR